MHQIVTIISLLWACMAHSVERIEYVPDFPSQHIGNRAIWIALPDHYDSTQKAYPLIIALDGENIFDRRSPYGGWQFDKALASHEIIVAAISHSGERMHDYSPSKDKNYGGGGGDVYLRFLVEEFLPWIHNRYRIRDSARHRTILGSSLGGLFAFYAGWQRPDVFGNVIAMSPSFWWNNSKLLESVKNYTGKKKSLRIYIDSGDQGPSHDGLFKSEAMRDALELQGFRHGVDLMHWIERGAYHNEYFWRTRLYRPLNFVFSKKRP